MSKKGVQTLQNIVSRKGSSKVLTFGIPHVFKALQMLSEEEFVSRATLGREIRMGEGAIKTMILHLKEASMIDSVRSGSFLTKKGRRLTSEMQKIIPSECSFGANSLTLGRKNHAVILKRYASAIKAGLEQRDYAVMYGASECVTLLFRKDMFVFPREDRDCLSQDMETMKVLQAGLGPSEGDVVIISSSDDPFVAEISAKNAALRTIATS